MLDALFHANTMQAPQLAASPVRQLPVVRLQVALPAVVPVAAAVAAEAGLAALSAPGKKPATGA